MEATAPDRDRRIGAPTRALLREPLLWAAAAALVGAAVGLVGTFHLAAWVSDPNGTMRSSSPLPWLAAPFGRMLVALSLLGVPALVAGVPQQVVRAARVLGIVLVSLFPLLFLLALSLQLGWLPTGGTASTGGPPLVFVVLSVVNLCLPSVAVVPFAAVVLLGRRWRLGTLLLGLCVLAGPSLLVWQVVRGGIVGEIPADAVAFIVLGGLGIGVGLPEAALWALLGALLFGGARRRADGEAGRLEAEENRRRASKLYEEGLGKDDLSVVDVLVSEDFRDLKSDTRGRPGMERVFSALWESYPDLAVSIESQEAEGDVVRTRLVLSGTDEGGVLWYPRPRTGA